MQPLPDYNIFYLKDHNEVIDITDCQIMIRLGFGNSHIMKPCNSWFLKLRPIVLAELPPLFSLRNKKVENKPKTTLENPQRMTSFSRSFQWFRA